MGARKRDEFLNQIRRWVQIDNREGFPGAIAAGDWAEHLAEAVIVHSRYRPRIVTALLSGDGLATQFVLETLTVPFEPGFSELQLVEHPAGNAPPDTLALDAFTVARNISGQVVVRFIEGAPVSGTNNIRLDYTARHTLDDLTNTVADADFFAVCHLAAGRALQSLANQFAQQVDSSIGASERGPRTASDVFASRAKEHRRAYFEHMGLADNGRDGAASGLAPASSQRDYDTRYTWGRDWLTHRSKWL